MTAAMILQARMTSTRLPGKVMRVLEGRTVLEWMIRLSRHIQGIDIVCVATPEGDEHEPVVREAQRLRAVVVRGSETNVLDRFYKAAKILEADEIMRVTTDCPFADPQICGAVLARLRQEHADYASNNDPFTFPHGLDCEVFTRESLERAAREAWQPYDLEHVTPWIKRETSLKRTSLHGPGGDYPSWRWTLDTPEDLTFFQAVARHIGSDMVPSWHQIADIVRKHPEYHDINRMCRVDRGILPQGLIIPPKKEVL